MNQLLVRCSGTDLPDWVIERAGQLGVLLTSPRTDDVLAPEVMGEELAALGADGDLLDAAGGLRLVTYLGQSTEPAAYTSFADLDALRERGIPFTHAPAVPSSVAEGAMALLLALNLGVVPANAARKAGEPPASRTRNGLRGSTLGIVGMGQIGRQVAELATAFGMRVLYSSRTRRPDIEALLGVRFAELPDLLAEADAVSLHTPPGTSEGLITAELLALVRGWLAYLETLTALLDNRRLPYRLV